MMGSKTVEPKYLVDTESFAFAEYWLDEHAERHPMPHTELMHHKWELANEVQMCVEDYFNHELSEERKHSHKIGRPTIHELEDILARDDDDYEVIVNPDGSVAAAQTTRSRDV